MDRKFEIEQLDQERLIKSNNLPEVTNPVLFNAGNGPTSDGLLSNELFGITKEERSGIYGWIDLKEKFINPYYYKIWLKIDRNLRSCVYETQYFKINSDGYLEIDDNGETGIKFLIDNIDKINFKNTKKDNLLKALIDAKKQNKLFTKKFIIIPPFFRDVDTSSSGKVGVGEVNKLYINMMNNIRALSESNDYGLSITGNIKGKIQDTMLEIYNWFTAGETVIGGEHTGSGIFKKFGIIRRSVMSKTTDYSVRLVISAPNINVNTKEDLLVDLDYSGIPLSSVCVIAYPFMIYHMRQFFNNEFAGKTYYPYQDNDGKYNQIELDNIDIEFSDDRLDKELNEFIHGYSNRFKPIAIPNKEGKLIHMKFKGINVSYEDFINNNINNGVTINRELTWMDIFYRCAVRATKDKMCIISRYPIDSHFNQLYTKIHVLSTINTEPIVLENDFYKWYPKIRESDISTNTSNKFIDTCQMCNAYLKLMGGDYDGDQVTVKMPFSVEANKELEDHLNSNGQFITLNGENGRMVAKECMQAMYNLTLVLPGTKLINPEF